MSNGQGDEKVEYALEGDQGVFTVTGEAVEDMLVKNHGPGLLLSMLKSLCPPDPPKPSKTPAEKMGVARAKIERWGPKYQDILRGAVGRIHGDGPPYHGEGGDIEEPVNTLLKEWGIVPGPNPKKPLYAKKRKITEVLLELFG